MTYQPIPIKTEAGIRKALTSDDSVEELLVGVLKEMKTMNEHLSIISGLENEDED